MATTAYMAGRKRYQRPQGILWSDNPGTLIEGSYVPTGYEVGTNPTGLPTDQLNQFLILSDHNRGEINIPLLELKKEKELLMEECVHIILQISYQFRQNEVRNLFAVMSLATACIF